MPKKIRFLTEYAVHYLKKYLWVIIAGAIFGSFFYIQRDRVFQIYQTLSLGDKNIGTEGLYTNTNLPSWLTNQISLGFTTISENNKPVLSPLVSQLTIGDNNLLYTFTFRDNLYWSNGQRFNPSDINLKIPGVTSKVISPTKVEIALKKPFSPIMSILSRPVFQKNSLVGVMGHYSVQSQTFQDGYIKQLALQPVGDGQRVIYHFYTNSQDLLNAFKLGEVDEITTSLLDSQITTWPKVKVTPSISDQEYLAIFINTDKLNNKQIRQAIAYATPKTNDKNSRCLGPISPNSWAYNSEIKGYNFNPTRAQELYPKGSLDHLNLLVTDSKLLDKANNIKQNWERILGVKVNLSVASRQINYSDYETLLTYGSVPSDPDQYSFWHSTQINSNVTHLNNSRIDKLLEEGRQVSDQLQRKSIYADFQRFLLEESPAIFLEFPTTYTISRIK